MTTEIHTFASSQALVAAAAHRLVAAIEEAVSKRGIAHIVLTGGSNGIALLSALRELAHHVDWSAVHLYWGDERFVPADDQDRNFGQAANALLDHVPLHPNNIHPMDPSDGPFGDDLAAAVRAYEADLAKAPDGFCPEFDVHLLGMGDEGHINSLFPGSAATAESDRAVVAVSNSPKPPSRRITLTLPAVNRSRQVWFLVSGASKAAAVAAGVNHADPTEWPCAGARGTVNTVWFLDHAAASGINRQ